MLTVRLSSDLEKRLRALARKTGRAKSGLAREAILRHIEDLEDYYLARKRLARHSKSISLEDLETEFSQVLVPSQKSRIKSDLRDM
jgi:RHH-type transcriptional regulator, rel operon repressor / antitoxin RelB